MMLSNNVYDFLKYLVITFLPAVTALWLGVATIWHIPYAEPIGATVALITTFLGTLIGISNVKYNIANPSNDIGDIDNDLEKFDSEVIIRDEDDNESD